MFRRYLHRDANIHTWRIATLQNIEASIFNNLKPVSEYYFTLHDAIYYTNIVDTALLSEQILEKFKVLNIKPKLSFE